MQINYFKVLGLVGMLAGELTKAAEDGTITAAEGLSMAFKICTSLGLEFDNNISDLLSFADDLILSASDGKITMDEATNAMINLCNILGLELERNQEEDQEED